MEALAAVGLASSICQFISFSTDLISSSKEIYQSMSGSTKELDDLDSVVQCLADFALSLTPAQSPESLEKLDPSVRPIKDEINLVRLATRCRDTALSLQGDLKSLNLGNNTSPKRSKAASLRLAIKLKQGKHVGRLQKTLDGYRKDLMLYLIAVSQNKESAMLTYLEELKSTNLNIVHDHAEKLDEIFNLVTELPQKADLVLKKDNVTVQLQLIAKGLETIAASSARQWIPEHEIVRRLYFEQLPIRHGSIPRAHAETFQWLLQEHTEIQEDEDDCLPKTTMLEWLQTGSGIYWVTGKPGSGKSTLMKFLAGHAKTQKALDLWASSLDETDYGSCCITANYYFWSAGTPLQKSVEGLLRSLLFEILVQAPELIPVAFPNRWAAMRTAGHMYQHASEDDPWTKWNEPELTEALRLLSQIPPAPGKTATKRFCFFIDGLDEFHGDHRELVQILSDLASPPTCNQTIKLCLSSRPWNVFEDTLGLYAVGQKLSVHELTRGDITAYINETLRKDSNWLAEAAASSRYSHLVDEITDKAQGVFLWVMLVVRSLIEGLSNGDSLQMLERRVHEMPQELGPFFRHMLSSVPLNYQRHMAIYFRIALDTSIAPISISLMHLSFLDDCLENPKYALDLPIRSMGKDEMSRRHNTMRRRLNARCKGLLEIDKHKPTIPYLAHNVILLHRTVHDFLLTDEMAEFLDSRIGGSAIKLLFFNAHVAHYKSIPRHDNNDLARMLEITFKIALHIAGAAESELEVNQEAIEMTVQAVDELLRVARTRADFVPSSNTSVFADLVVTNGLCHYLAAAIDARAAGFTELSTLLKKALTSPPSSRCTDVLAILLDKMKTETPEACLGNDLWLAYIPSLSAVIDTHTTDTTTKSKEVLDFVLPHVADVNAYDPSGVAWGSVFGNILHCADAPRALVEIRVQMVASILSQGADPNAPYSGTTVWGFFCQYLCDNGGVGIKTWKSFGNMDCLASLVKMFLRAGADVASFPLPEETVRSHFPPRLAHSICNMLQERLAATPPTSALVTKWSAFFRGFLRSLP